MRLRRALQRWRRQFTTAYLQRLYWETKWLEEGTN